MAKRVRGYPLPSDLEYTEDICPVALCIPNADWARQALYSSLRYLATWVAYQRDSSNLGKLAADSWKYALESMGGEDCIMCLDDLINDVADIKELLVSKKDCCDDNITYGPSDTLDTEIIPDSGDPPDYYGETAVADWDDWAEHVCYNAHLWVDMLIQQAENIETALDVGAVAIGVVAAALAIIGFVATGGAISFVVASAIAAALSSGGAASMFSQSADDIEDARADIICALLNYGNVADVVEDALSIPSAWTLFFQFVDYDTATAVIYEGGFSGNYLPTETRSDCYCVGNNEMYIGGVGDLEDQQHVGLVSSAGCYQADGIQFRDKDTLADVAVTINQIGAIGGANCGGANKYRMFDWSWTLVYNASTPPPPTGNIRYITLKSTIDVNNILIDWEA